jgi:hypothetical protein
MAAPTLGHIILTGALIAVIFAVQVFYFYVVDNISSEMLRRELKELTDYVADTITNLYLLLNSTNTNPPLEKSLRLPRDISGSFYTFEITSGANNSAENVKGVIQGKSWLNVTSWLPRGLKVDVSKTQIIGYSVKTAVAGCLRVASNVYVWIAYKE